MHAVLGIALLALLTMPERQVDGAVNEVADQSSSPKLHLATTRMIKGTTAVSQAHRIVAFGSITQSTYTAACFTAPLLGS